MPLRYNTRSQSGPLTLKAFLRLHASPTRLASLFAAHSSTHNPLEPYPRLASPHAAAHVHFTATSSDMSGARNVRPQRQTQRGASVDVTTVVKPRSARPIVVAARRRWKKRLASFTLASTSLAIVSVVFYGMFAW